MKSVILVFGIGAFSINAYAEAWFKAEVEGKPFETKSDFIVKPKDKFPKWMTKIRIRIDQEFRYDKNWIINEESMIALGYDIFPWLSAYAGFNGVYERDDNRGPMIFENRPTFDLIFKAPEFYTLKLDWRSRFEYRDKKHSSPYWRFAERIRLRTTWSLTDYKLSPYISDEIFVSRKKDTSGSEMIDRNRLQAGISFNPVLSIEAIQCNLYYQLQHDRNSDDEWYSTSIIGVELRYKF